jgi:hypothetical protein
MHLRDRIARLERELPHIPRGGTFPNLHNMARDDVYVFAVALEAGYWMNLLEQFECALIFTGESITATQGKVIGKYCREVMASDQPKSKPWANPRS